MTAAPYTRPDWVRRVNAMGSAYVGGPAAMVALDADELVASARSATGLEDFGDASWEEPFRRLIDALDTEAQLHTTGRLLCRHDALRHLCTRLALVDASTRDARIADEPISPIFVTGPARSGTSILHELLAEDPALRAPYAYEMAYPAIGATRDVPAEERQTWAESEFDLWGDVQPEFLAVHELAAHLPEECLWLFAPDFDIGFWTTCVEIPSFIAWRAVMDPIPLYEGHRRFLQTLQRGDEARPWALKSPLHLGRLPALFAVYPDARVIRTHRDPAKTIPSMVSTLVTGRWLRSDAVDATAIAQGAGFGMDVILNAAADDTSSPAGQIADVHYVDLMRDPVSTIRSAYGDLGLEFAPELGPRITAYLESRPPTKYGVHRYTPGDFGLDAGAIREQFARYIEVFGVEAESSG